MELTLSHPEFTVEIVDRSRISIVDASKSIFPCVLDPELKDIVLARIEKMA